MRAATLFDGPLMDLEGKFLVTSQPWQPAIRVWQPDLFFLAKIYMFQMRS